MTMMLLAALALAQQVPAEKLTSVESPAPSEAPAEATGERAATADDEEICRNRPLQRQGLITRSRKVCKTRAEWKASAGRPN